MSAPSISIVIPAYARPERLRECLAALARQEGGPYETIVVDDGSPEPLAAVCAQAGPWVRSIRQSNAGPAAARNAGVRAATGDFICFTDDDCAADVGWARALQAAQGGNPANLVGGMVENALVDNLFSEISQSIANWLPLSQRRLGRAPEFFASNNLGCGRKAFLDMGGFDESFPLAAGEDREFGRRWQALTGTLVFAPGARIRHRHELNLRSFWRQQANYGRGARHLRHVGRRSAEGGQAGAAHRFSTPAFYAALVLHPWRLQDTPWRRRLALVALAFVSQAAITGGFLAGPRRTKARHATSRR